MYSLIGKLLIGYVDTARDSDSEDEDDESTPSYLPAASSSAIAEKSDGFAVPEPRPSTTKDITSKAQAMRLSSKEKNADEKLRFNF
jgi:hypothetical protein